MDLVTFTEEIFSRNFIFEEILNGKLRFLRIAVRGKLGSHGIRQLYHNALHTFLSESCYFNDITFN